MRNESVSETQERPALRIVPPSHPERDALEAILLGWQLRKPEWNGGKVANAIFRELKGDFTYSDPLVGLCQRAIDDLADNALPITPQHVATRVAVDNPEVPGGVLFEDLRTWSLGAPASGTESNLRREMAHTLNLLREGARAGARADRRHRAHEMLLTKGAEVIDEARALLDDAPVGTSGTFLSSGDFLSGYTPFDYLWDGILQRGYLYNLTGQTGAGKTELRPWRVGMSPL